MRKETGLTLIEILVVIGVFSGLMSVIAGIFISNSRIQRRGIAVQKALGETSYAVEYMTRSMRMAKSDDDGDCLDSGYEYYTYQVRNGGEEVRYIDYRDRCVNFVFDYDEGAIKKGLRTNGTWEEYYLTSEVLNVNNLHFSTNVSPDSGTADLFEEQPAVTLVMELEETETGQWGTRVQTSVTRRKLDIQRDTDD